MPSNLISNRVFIELLHPGILDSLRDDQAQIIDGTPGFPIAGGTIIRTPMPRLNAGQAAKLDRWQPLVNAAQAVIAGVQASVGVFVRDVPNGALGGTAFVVGPRLLLTNRHVADNIFTLPEDDAQVLVTPPVISTRHFISFSEKGDGEPKFYPVRVLAASTQLDYALVEVADEEGKLPAALPLATTPEKVDGEQPEGSREIRLAGQPFQLIRKTGPPEPLPNYPWTFGVGYPESMPWDRNEETGFVFNGLNGAKTVLPGMVLKLRACPIKGKVEKVVVFESAYSSLPNCSGMPVCRADNGLVVGLHFDGQADLGNYAVPLWTIVEDLRAKLGNTDEGRRILGDMRL